MFKVAKFIKIIIVRWEEVLASHLLIASNHCINMNKIRLNSESRGVILAYYLGIRLKKDEVGLKKWL